MKKGAVISIIVIVIVAVLVGWWIYDATTSSSVTTTGSTSTSTSAESGTSALTFDQTLSDGSITLSYPSTDFALATTSADINVSSYIPPCNGNFDDCLYYIATSTYAGTNFETAGIRIDERTDLTTESQCLNAEPDGFTGVTSTIATSSEYAASTFPEVGGAAAGHFANGSLYRLFYGGSCYEFETRVGQTDFYNYPSGTVQQFTTADEAALQSELQSILATITLPDGSRVTFPQ